MIGICNPNAYDVPQYLGYDITRLKGNIRFMEVVLNRDGEANGICPLLFNGAINSFKEAPLTTQTVELESICSSLEKARAEKREQLKQKESITLFTWASQVINKIFANNNGQLYYHFG